MKRKNKTLFILLSFLFLSAGCKKITTPNEDAKKLFGEWQYLHDYGEFEVPSKGSRFSTDNWVEYTERGKYTVHNGGKTVRKKRFTIEMKMTAYNGNSKKAIVYKDGGYDTFQVSNDTLFLGEAGYDGYNYVFVKK